MHYAEQAKESEEIERKQTAEHADELQRLNIELQQLKTRLQQTEQPAEELKQKRYQTSLLEAGLLPFLCFSVSLCFGVHVSMCL